MNGITMGELTGLVRKLLGEMRGFREELREMKEVVEKGLKNVAMANHLWHQTPIVDALDYAEWWVEFPQEEMDWKYQELWLEDGMYWEYLRGKIDGGELNQLVDERLLDYKLEKGKVEVGPKVELEE